MSFATGTSNKINQTNGSTDRTEERGIDKREKNDVLVRNPFQNILEARKENKAQQANDVSLSNESELTLIY